jgi:hypothetical protein
MARWLWSMSPEVKTVVNLLDNNSGTVNYWLKWHRKARLRIWILIAIVAYFSVLHILVLC